MQWISEWKGTAFLSHGSNVSAGVAVLFSPDLQIKDSRVEEIIPGRTQLFDIKLYELSFSLINNYAPNDGVERVSFFRKLRGYFKSFT